MLDKDLLMVELNSNFQREIFKRVINKYKGSIKASKIIEIPASSIRGYKNAYFRTIPNYLIRLLIKLKITNNKEVSSNTLRVVNKQEIINCSLNLGREKRREYFIQLRKNIPKLKEILENNFLNIHKWFDKYKNLVASNFRKISFKDCNKNILIKYNNFTKKGFKDFEVLIPRKMLLDENFLYFFGLWCGDRSGGKRFGICNKNKGILEFTEDFLIKHSQRVEKILYIKKEVALPRIDYDKKFEINEKGKGWVLSIHSNNGIFSSFFYYLLSQLDAFLNIIQKKEVFFAGLFDAEGNVSLYNKSFRWACKNSDLIKIYSHHLKKLGLYDKYDGSSLISYNQNGFFKLILPFLKNKNKINLTNILYKGKGEFPKIHRIILNYLKNNPHKSSKEIAKALKKTKVYSELSLLRRFNYISSIGHIHKFKLTNKGKKSIGA